MTSAVEGWSDRRLRASAVLLGVVPCAPGIAAVDRRMIPGTKIATGWRHHPMKLDERPFIAIWETTQACDLACAHCRASARPGRDQQELDTEEGHALLEAFARAPVPLVVLT